MSIRRPSCGPLSVRRFHAEAKRKVSSQVPLDRIHGSGILINESVGVGCHIRPKCIVREAMPGRFSMGIKHHDLLRNTEKPNGQLKESRKLDLAIEVASKIKNAGSEPPN